MQLEMTTAREQRSGMREFAEYMPRSDPEHTRYHPAAAGVCDGVTVTRAEAAAQIDGLRRCMREVVRCRERREPEAAVAEAIGIGLRTVGRELAEALDALAASA
jgi:hypothetical protein